MEEKHNLQHFNLHSFLEVLCLVILSMNFDPMELHFYKVKTAHWQIPKIPMVKKK